MSAVVGREFFHDRLTNQYAHHYHLIVSIFKGVALSSAAISLLAIFSSQEHTGVKLTALALWLASLTVIITTYDGIMVASIIVTASPNVLDVVGPFLMGVAEFALFAVLSPLTASGADAPSTAAQFSHLAWWPLVYALLAATASMDIWNSRVQLRGSIDAAPAELRPLLHWYLGSLSATQRSTSITGAAMLLAFLALRYGPDGLRKGQAVIAAVVVAGMVSAILSEERARRKIAESVSPEGRPSPEGD